MKRKITVPQEWSAIIFTYGRLSKTYKLQHLMLLFAEIYLYELKITEEFYCRIVLYFTQKI